MTKFHAIQNNQPPFQGSNRRLFNAAILITEGFSLLSLTSLIDVLDAVQTASPLACVDVTILTLDGTPVRARSKVQIASDGSLLDNLRRDTLLPRPDVYAVCSGPQMSAAETALTLELVRKCRLSSTPVCAMGAAVRVIAQSGLITKGTDHWSRIPANRETLPHIDFEDSIFVKDGNLISCSGELGAMDFALNWVENNISTETATRIRNYLLLQSTRSADRAQTCSAADRYRGAPPKLQQAINLMLDNLEEPLSVNTIAAIIGLSVRQVERLFLRYLGTSPVRFYRMERLELGRSLVEDTNMPITEIALACGFKSLSSFIKLFRNNFGATPITFRASKAA
ncbi:Helix-turn-helix, AraC type:ThiJ/PfpI [Roseobacter sp. SK209-2-6]|uniref:GlxA family transcriptional regulator n=1 Tax=Roseobacter sp. SK209-2-6 TaxID=388739 RepID=UPI0000F3F4F9|nr:helix-turn-helix domain-containing protein [Roseobacter sp. SK209-2-6]EBA14756.1 Helix-turn-helix, AraC type:ThiJ/PfpI [Roseobacter sp. SK209-2-6]